jgi:thioredoxin 1
MVEYANKDNFSDLIREGLVLVDFYADWCGPCKMLGPVLDNLAEELKGKVKIVKVNVDELSEIAQEYGVMSIPTLILFENGTMTKQNIGFLSKDMLKEWMGVN